MKESDWLIWGALLAILISVVILGIQIREEVESIRQLIEATSVP